MNASELITKRIAETEGWRGEVYVKLRGIVNAADPGLTEEWKWDTSVWTKNGKLVLAVGAMKDWVKINFFRGSELEDPHKLINNGLTSKNHRAIDFHEGDPIPEQKLTKLIQEATKLND